MKVADCLSAGVVRGVGRPLAVGWGSVLLSRPRRAPYLLLPCLIQAQNLSTLRNFGTHQHVTESIQSLHVWFDGDQIDGSSPASNGEVVVSCARCERDRGTPKKRPCTSRALMMSD